MCIDTNWRYLLLAVSARDLTSTARTELNRLLWLISFTLWLEQDISIVSRALEIMTLCFLFERR